MRTLVTDTIYDYLTPKEADACRSYQLAFASEYERLQDRETDELALLRYWSDLAHRAALMRCRSSAA
jgi:hypothetical protein